MLDCNTGKMWLKDASCLGPWPYEDGGNPNIFEMVTDLNNGTDFGCADYTAGTYTDWEVPTISELCSAGASVQPCPAGNASDSLVDSSVPGSPKVVNAQGDAGWTTDGDAFVGVQSGNYWSATEINTGSAWNVDLGNGDVNSTLKGFFLYVWLVRVGQ